MSSQRLFCYPTTSVAALIGDHPYQDREVSFQRIASQHQVRLPVDVDLLSSYPGLREKVTTTGKVWEALQATGASGEEYERLASACVSIIDRVHKRTRQEYEEVIQKAIQDGSTVRLKGVTPLEQSIVTSAVNCSRGISREGGSLNQHARETNQKVITNDKKYYVKTFQGEEGIQFKVGGRVDGRLTEGGIVEVKNRMNRFMDPIPNYETIQCQLYMKIHPSNPTTCQLVQTFKGENKVTVLTADEALVADILKRLGETTRRLTSLRGMK